jgi:small-conductance mechanosensitive channel/CRP-like cAMP-binding protein
MEQALTATSVLLAGFIGAILIPGPRQGLKAVWTAIAFSLFTAALVRTIGSPLTPNYAGLAKWHAIWAETLEAFWWLAAARMAVAVMHAWAGADRKLGNSRLATDIIAAAVYVIAALAITNDVLQIPIRGLLATSGVIAIVLGLALQSTLSDVFSGISINIEEPFEVGDIIQLDGAIEGTVTQVNWRATHILTGMDDIAVIPNSVVAKVRIINRSRPATRRGASVTLSLDTRTSTGDGIRVLRDAAIAATTPLRDPAPSVQCTALRANGVEYEVTFYVRTDTDMAAARTEVVRHIHGALAWAGIPIARTEGALPEIPDPTDRAAAAVRKMRLIGLFKALSAEEITALASKITPQSLAPGAVAVGQGTTGDYLFIVEAGVLEVTRADAQGGTEMIGRLGPGDHFGETSVLAGDRLGATATAMTDVTLYVLAKTDLAPLLKDRPDLVKEFCTIVANQRRAFANHAATAFHAAPADGSDDALLHRIERFLHVAPQHPG